MQDTNKTSRLKSVSLADGEAHLGVSGDVVNGEVDLNAWSRVFDQSVDLKSWDYPSRLHLIANLNHTRIQGRRLFRLVKRLVDISLVLGALLLLWPVFLAAAVAVRWTSPGPSFYVQSRVGHRLLVFRIFKFRTMYQDATKADPIYDVSLKSYRRATLAEDSRITPVGRFLRRWSLDELPQLFNVLLGDMSLIGPRPLTIEEALKIPEEAFCRYAVLPGLSGLAQVKARSVVVDPSRFQWDIEYLKQLGVKQELSIFWRTFRAIRDKS